MRIEDFFKLCMEQLLGLERTKTNKYFNKFRNNFKNIPSVLESLDKTITDTNGAPLTTREINKYVEILSQHFKTHDPIVKNVSHEVYINKVKLFIKEIKLQIEFLKQSYSEYENEKTTDSIDTKKIFLHIHHFSAHVANVCKLYDKLKDFLFLPSHDDSDVDTTLTKELRNHLEHFDESLDAWNYLHFGNPLLDMNIINSSTKGIKLENCLRVLDVDEDTFHILGESYSINEL